MMESVIALLDWYLHGFSLFFAAVSGLHFVSAACVRVRLARALWSKVRGREIEMFKLQW